MEAEAKEALILDLLAIYRTGDRISDAGISAMLAGVEPYSLDTVRLACTRFRDGLVEGRNAAFPPEAPEMIAEVRRLDGLRVADRPLQGVLEVNFGHGTIRTGHLTSAEVDFVFHHKGMLPDGRNMAMLMADDLKAEIARPALALPAPEPKSMADIVPHLQRFSVDA